MMSEKAVYPGVVAYPSLGFNFKRLRLLSFKTDSTSIAESGSVSSAEEFKDKLKKDEAFMSEEQIRDRYFQYWECKQNEVSYTYSR